MYLVYVNTQRLLEDTPETYYWLGFLLADGHFARNSQLGFCLAIKDSEQVHRLKAFLGCTNKLSIRNGAVGFTVQDCHVREFISKYCIASNKTYYPPPVDIFNALPHDFFIAMLIGYTDGDGSITYQHKRTDCFIRWKVHSSWKPFLHMLAQRMSQYCPVCFPIVTTTGYAAMTWADRRTCKYLKREMIRLSLPSLSRKWDKIDLASISRREQAVLNREAIQELASAGMAQKDIVKTLGLSPACVSTHLKGFSY